MVVLLAASCLGMVSCGGYSNSEARELIRKAKDDKLKKDDYARMIEWYEDIQGEYYDGWEKVIEDNRKYEDYYLDNIEFMAGIAGRYPFFGNMEQILDNADEDKMGSANYKKYTRLKEKFGKRMNKLGDKVPEMESGEGRSAYDIPEEREEQECTLDYEY